MSDGRRPGGCQGSARHTAQRAINIGTTAAARLSCRSSSLSAPSSMASRYRSVLVTPVATSDNPQRGVACRHGNQGEDEGKAQAAMGQALVGQARQSAPALQASDYAVRAVREPGSGCGCAGRQSGPDLAAGRRRPSGLSLRQAEAVAVARYIATVEYVTQSRC